MRNPITQTITMTVVPNSKRPAFLPEKTSAAYLAFETALYGIADNLSRDYDGGYWEFCELSNGGFYCCRDTEDDFDCVSSNGFECRMSADAFGITATLFALNCAMDGQSGATLEKLVDGYYRLRDYAAGHEEAARIFRMID